MKHRVILASALALSTLSCGTLRPGKFGLEEVEKPSAYSAASVTLSTFDPISWYAVRADLKPNFGIKTATPLLADVAPLVGEDAYQASRRFSAALSAEVAGDIAQSSQSNQSSSATDAAGVAQTTSSSSASSSESSATPEKATAQAATLASKLPANPSSFPTTFDPDMKYRAATALFQNIQLLDRYIDNAAFDDRPAYLIRSQITVSPFAHQLPYDVFATLKFAANDQLKSQCYFDSFRIFPLIVADNLERVNTRRIAEELTSIQLALSGRSGPFSGGAAMQAALDRLRALVGADLNSLVTYTQPNDSSLMIRLGAPFDARSGYAMRARTYDVTFVMTFAKDCYDALLALQAQKKTEKSGSSFPATLSMYLEAGLRHARTGESLPQMSDAELAALDARAKSARSLSRRWPQSVIDEKCVKVLKKGWADKIRLAIFGPYDQSQCVINYVYKELRDYALTRDLEHARRAVGHSSTTLEFADEIPAPPSDQIPVFSDDGAKTTVLISGAQRNNLQNARAYLHVARSSGSVRAAPGIKLEAADDSAVTAFKNLRDNGRLDGPFAHTATSVDGRVLAVQFPSLAALGIDSNSNPAWMTLSFDPDGKERTLYSLRKIVKNAAPPQTAATFAVKKLSPTFVSGSDAGAAKNAHAHFVVAPVKGVTPIARRFRVVLDGAMMEEFQQVADNGAAVPGGATPKLKTNSAEFEKLDALYRIILTTKEAPKNDVKITIVGLGPAGEELEKIEEKFDAAK